VPRKRLRLWGSEEVRRALGGVSRARAYVLTSRKGFPDPVATLRNGRVWDADKVAAWIAANRTVLAEDPEGEQFT
jgi:prophage regulatory protein